MAVGNLELINETEITSTVSSVDITDVFSADFDIYQITVSAWANTSTQNVRFQFINSSGSVVTASNYDKATLELLSWTTFGEQRGTNQNNIGEIFYSSSSSDTGNSTIFIFNPYSISTYSFLLSQGAGVFTGQGNINQKTIGVLKQTASMTGFRLFPQALSVSSGTIRTYGLASN